MIETLKQMPVSFWVVVALLGGGAYWSTTAIRRGIGIPSFMVLVTIAAWYVGDAFYNDYQEWHSTMFLPQVLTAAWWQVALFLVMFLALTPQLHAWLNARHLGRSSQALLMFKRGLDSSRFQNSLSVLFGAAAAVWVCLLIGAVFRFRSGIIYYFFPYLGGYAGPWVTTGVAGAMDTLLALANYLQIMVGAVFGFVAALSTNKRIRNLALIGVFLTWPYYIFDRTRKSILAICLPGIVAWVFIRLRRGLIVKCAILFAGFLLINAWFGFIMEHRSNTVISKAFAQEGFDYSTAAVEKHQGLNMFEELCWINTLTTDGIFNPQWGQNYFANLVNPIPRALWPGKPTIGLDYAVARGAGDADAAAGVFATLSNGLIGQGVVNFGPLVGPAFAALLMGLWVCWLARLDLEGYRIGYFPLYGLGLILTFTLGRDITFLDLYPFVFGYAICWWLNRGNAAQRHEPEGVLRRRRERVQRSSRNRRSTVGATRLAKTRRLPSSRCCDGQSGSLAQPRVSSSTIQK